MARGSLAWHSRHFLWMSLVRLERETISWRVNILARWVSSRHGAQRGCPQVLQKYMVSSSCVRGHSWWQAWPWQVSLIHPVHPAALTALVQQRSQLAHCTSSSLSAELSTRNCRSRSTGGSPVPPLTTEGCLWGQDGDKVRDTPPGQQGSFGDAGSSAVLSCQLCAVPQTGLSLTRRVDSAGGHRWHGLAGSWRRSCGSSRAGRGAGRARGRAGTPTGGSWPSPAQCSSPAGRKCHLPSCGVDSQALC